MKSHIKILVCVLSILLLFITCAKQEEAKLSGFVAADDVQLHYIIEGEGIPCIIAGDALVTSRGLSKELRNHFKFIITDFRFNIPEDQSGETSNISLGTLVDDIEAVRKALGFQTVCLFGHSIWGLVAFEYAREYPDHTSHVIMNGTPPGLFYQIGKVGKEYWDSHATDERKRTLQENWQKLPEDTLHHLSPGEASQLSYITDAPKYWYNPKYDCSWVFVGVHWNRAVLNQVMNVSFADYDIAKGDPVNTPVFLSLGRHDYVVPYYLWNGKKNKITDLSYNLFEKSGHWAMLEEQEWYDQKLIEWIKIH